MICYGTTFHLAVYTEAEIVIVIPGKETDWQFLEKCQSDENSISRQLSLLNTLM